MTDTVFDVTWTIVEGDGYFINENDTGVVFVAGSAGSSEPVVIRLYDMKGSLHKEKNLSVHSAGKHSISLSTGELCAGTYLY